MASHTGLFRTKKYPNNFRTIYNVNQSAAVGAKRHFTFLRFHMYTVSFCLLNRWPNYLKDKMRGIKYGIIKLRRNNCKEVFLFPSKKTGMAHLNLLSTWMSLI